MLTTIKSAVNGFGLDFCKHFSNNAPMAKTPKHGGKRVGAGRPAAPPDERRDQVFGVRVTADEKQLLDETDARTWARDVLVKAAQKRR